MPVELVDEAGIRAALNSNSRPLLAEFLVYDRIDSTNSHLLREAARYSSGTVCLAESQFAGRGRIGRRWVSPFGANVYLSVLWRFSDMASTSGLSLAVGVAAARALGLLGLKDVSLKWPNDVLWRGRKLGGILLDIAGEAYGQCTVVVGLGVNRFLPASAASGIDQGWTDLAEALGGPLPSKNQVIVALLNELVPLLDCYAARGLGPVLAEWKRLHCLHGRMVTVTQGKRVTSGKVVDVTAEGLLVLETVAGEMHSFASGDLRLRAVPDRMSPGGSGVGV
jgi:BirA family biotin operon repressor/biotin-[acetyl-CoA-carboxylase] ligase